jgi:hypothetical protein
VQFPCVIDTATEFTTVPRGLLLRGMHVAPVRPDQQVPVRAKDYLGFLWYKFPARHCDAVSLAGLEFRCDACRVTDDRLHHVHLALRDIRDNFDWAINPATRRLILTLRVGHKGYSSTP